MNWLNRFKKYILALLDVIMVTVAFCGSYFFSGLQMNFGGFFSGLYMSIVTYLLVFLVLGIYNNIVSYFSIREYAACLFACLVSGLLVCMEKELFSFPGTIRQIMLSAILSAVLCVGMRIAIRTVLRHRFIINRLFGRHTGKRLLIIGAGEAGNHVIRELSITDNQQYDIVGLIDDNPAKIGCRISGYKVLGNRHAIPSVCKNYKVQVLLFAIPTANGEARKAILDICKTTGCQLQVLPGINELISGKPIMAHMRKINVTDILSRDPVRLNNKDLGRLIENHVVMVTGGGGSIGSELCRNIARFHPAKLLILDIYENNAYDIQQELKNSYPELQQQVIIASVRDQARLDEIFAKHRPSLVFHAAAHKHVPLMEDDPQEAVKNNVFGTLHVAECADKYGVDKFVLISTDKAVNPTNVMGATKRLCEMIIQAMDNHSHTEYVAVRFGNVLGSSGSVIPLFQRQIAAGGPVTVTHKDITRFFMTIPEAAQLVLQAASYATGGEIFLLDMGEPVKIYDLAENLIKLSGLQLGRDIEIKIIGLRPGEKLYEELMMEEENLISTQNEKIFITQPLSLDMEELRAGLNTLQKLVHEGNKQHVKEAIAAMVSTYTIDTGCCVQED
ncbi:MAG: polysaccharide biosynthesis protein [Ruminococcaceae bacterium]|nr:polysaccharide biosynthesis protein [Oscillospiraceae bacterium]